MTKSDSQADSLGDLMRAAQQGDSGARFTVEDDGPGIHGDPADLFKPFETDKPGGTGLFGF